MKIIFVVLISSMNGLLSEREWSDFFPEK